MVKKHGRRWLLASLMAVPLFAVVWLAFFYTEVGMANEIGEGARETPLTQDDYSTVPQEVIDDATALAREMVGDSQDRIQAFVDQLLASYVKARESDVVVVFNSGGWGWNLLEDTPGWNSIVEGIKAELTGSGCRPLVLNYQRTSHSLRSCFKEFIELLSRSPSKGKELARRVEFLTSHLPDIRVIVAGESTGTVVTDSSMTILRDNPQVYSIQTGTPFWHKPNLTERTLLMNSNGKTIDTFSYGKISSVVSATVKGWFGLLPPEENPGTILSWLRAPGHDYSWQYPGVCAEVTHFIERIIREKE